ncbi:hypothetical protein MBLNU230_g5397t1 [Neophaeotheca triangularis]
MEGKTAEAYEMHSPSESLGEQAESGNARPAGWRYRDIKLGPLTIPYYASPQMQLLLVAMVCFLCPGMFNAVNGLGGGGQLSSEASNASNTALYSTFAVVGFFAGTVTNVLGIKRSLSLGGLGYCIYVASYLCYNHTANFGFMVFAGFFLGCCAGILWSAQGAIMMAYPPENSKGRYIAWFWIIFNLGGVIGSLVPLGQNINTTTNSSVSDGTYVGFIILTALGAALAFTLTDAKNVLRYDNTRVIVAKHPSWKTELLGIWQTLFSDPYVVLLFPMFFASNYFYVYHFNDVNLAYFNTRTRALNNVLYWLSQMLGATIAGYLLDLHGVRRTIRARAAWASLLALTMVVWGGGYEFQKGYTRAEISAGTAPDVPPDAAYVKMDWTHAGYAGPMFLYIFYGMYDAVWQTMVYWFMGATTNNSRKLANFAGFYKGIQSAGAAVTWRLDGLENAPEYMTMFASCWGILAGSLLVALPVIWVKIEDRADEGRDLEFGGERGGEGKEGGEVGVVEEGRVGEGRDKGVDGEDKGVGL